MKKIIGLYYTGSGLSVLVGLWHFFVPRMFNWYEYIPSQHTNLIVAIDWVNYCFSFLLVGLSLLTFIWGKKSFSGNPEAITILGFLTLVWIFRLLLSIVEPWPLEPIAWAAYLQLIVTILITISLLISYVQLIRLHRKPS